MAADEGHSGALSTPPAVTDDPGAREVLRVWLSGWSYRVNYEKDWIEPRQWGVLLADVARFAASEVAGADVPDQVNVLWQIRQAFEQELDMSTDVDTVSAVKRL